MAAPKKRKSPTEKARGVFHREIGSLGGRIGGRKRWEGVSAAERSAAMKTLAAAKKAKAKARRKGGG
jgi:hypothetical protein